MAFEVQNGVTGAIDGILPEAPAAKPVKSTNDEGAK